MMLTLKEAAKLLTLHPNTLYRLAKNGGVPAKKVGGQWIFDQTTLETWISQGMTANLEKP